MKYPERSLLFRIYSNYSDAEQILILSGLFSAGLLSFRIFYTGSLLFAFLAWNLFLAFVPYAISKQMSKRIKKSNQFIFLFMAFTWLLFIPNAFYIITDLFHLDRNESVPL